MPFYQSADSPQDRVIVTCDCCGECREIHIQYDDEDKCAYVSLRDRSSASFWYRLKMSWKRLWNNPWDDEMVLDTETIVALQSWLAEKTK